MVLDSEMVIIDESGKTDFQSLQNYIKNPKNRILNGRGATSGRHIHYDREKEPRYQCRSPGMYLTLFIQMESICRMHF